MNPVKFTLKPATLAIFWFGLGLLSPALSASAQLDTDEILKPLVDTSSQRNIQSEPLQGNVQRKQSGFPSQLPNGQPMLKIQVKTYQEAVVLEKNIDWYAWYLAIRGYLNQTGGLNKCVLGTPIKIYKQGRIEALSPDPICRVSVGWRKFPLPRNTQLDALILPVRSGELPPASPEELQRRIRANEAGI